MKRFSLMMVLALICSLPAFSQFWINIEWGAPHCRHCEWMENALRLDPYEAAEYHRIIHRTTAVGMSTTIGATAGPRCVRITSSTTMIIWPSRSRPIIRA